MNKITLLDGFVEVEADFSRKKYCECGGGQNYFIVSKNNINEFLKFLKDASKKLRELDVKINIGKCDNCKNRAFGWIDNQKLCQKCIIKLYE